MKKQYSFEPSCNGNYEVFTYINGAVESSKIVSLHDLSVYIYQLKEKGYEFCYSDGEYYKIKLEQDRVDYLMEDIKKNRLYHEIVPAKNITFKQDEVTYHIRLNPDEDDILALWKCESDSGYCSHGYVFVDNTYNNEMCKFSPQNIDKYIKVECDDGIEPPVLIKRVIAYAVFDVIRRS